MRRFVAVIGVLTIVVGALTGSTAAAADFERGIVLTVDGVDYYLAGAPDGPGGAIDIPGHYWINPAPDRLVGRHFNTGPFGAPQWWSSDAPDGELLYIVRGVVDTWSPDKAESYARRGFVHYHELVAVDGGALHPTKVVWLRHNARTSFTLDGGPRPDLAHEVKPGLDREFINNYSVPYNP